MFLQINYIILGTSLMPDVLILNGDHFIKPFPTYTTFAADDLKNIYRELETIHCCIELNKGTSEKMLIITNLSICQNVFKINLQHVLQKIRLQVSRWENN